MVKGYKFRVKRLPKTVCISVHASKGRTLAKKKYVRRGKKRVTRSRRKVSKGRKVGSIKKCSEKRDELVCRRLAAKKCLTKKGTLAKSKTCRRLARNRGLKPKVYKRRRASPISRSGVFFGTTAKALGIPFL